MPELLNSYTGRIAGLVESPASAKREHSYYSILRVGRFNRIDSDNLLLKVSGPLKEYLWQAMHDDSDEYDMRKTFYYAEGFHLALYVVRSGYLHMYNEPVKIVANDLFEEHLRIWGPTNFISNSDTALPLPKSEKDDFMEWFREVSEFTTLF